MRTSRRISRLLGTAVVVLAGCGTDADRDLRTLADMVARGHGPDRSARAVAGRMPAELRPRIPLPPGTEVLGTLSGDSAHDIRARTPVSPGSADRFFARELPARGWVRGDPAFYCGPDGRALTASVEPRRPPPDELRVWVGPHPACGPSSPGGPYPRVDTLLPPRTPPPPGPGGSGRCGGLAVAWSGRAVPNGAPADSILAHYGRQLEAAGWRAVREPTPSVAGTWERSGVEGGRVTVTVTATGAPGHPDCTIALASSAAWTPGPGPEPSP